jgi:bacillolysin
MGNAHYIGRVGALAVALGIGTAVATTPWVAVAEQTADPSSESSSSDD